MRSARTRVFIAALSALVALTFATAAFGQTGDDDNFTDASERVTSARGGDGGDVRGGDGGRGGSGALPVCNQNNNDDDDFEDNRVACIAGASGGRGGDAGESVAGNGGVAFDLGRFERPAAPAAPSPEALADLFLSQRRGSFILVVTNNGPSTATNVILTDTLSVDGPFDIDGVTASQGSCDDVAGSYPAGSITFTCRLGTLAPGASATVSFGDPICEGSVNVVNTAFAVSDQRDPDPSTNSATLVPPTFECAPFPE